VKAVGGSMTRLRTGRLVAAVVLAADTSLHDRGGQILAWVICLGFISVPLGVLFGVIR